MNRPLKTGEKIAFALVWVVIAWGGWLVFSDFGTSSTATPTVVTQPKVHAEYEAYAMAETIVEKYLKAPATARFPSKSEATIESLKDDGWKITSYVDSQNGFGANIRSSWTALFVYENEDKADIYQVIIDGEEMYRKPGLK